VVAMADALFKLLDQPKTLPVLFVGSGLSKRYLKAPDWAALLAEFAVPAGRTMPYYRGKAANDLPTVASLIAEDFYEKWFTEKAYAASRSAFEASVRDIADPLKFEISQRLGALRRVNTRAMRKELSALQGLRVHAAITTNWDVLLEDLLPDLEVFVGQQDVLFANTQGLGELYKIHGSVTRPSSMVLTREDYDNYWERNPFLIAKMLTLFVEHPIVFLGYSLTDAHIQRMLSNLMACLSADQIGTLNDRLIFVRRCHRGESEHVRRAPMTIEGHTFDIQECSLSDFSKVYESVARLPNHFSVKLLRQVKKELYELASTVPPKGRIYTIGIEDDTDLDRVEVVIGIGTMARLAQKGYAAFDRKDLFLDMLTGETKHDPGGIVNALLPRIFRAAKYAPIYYPLRLARKVDGSGHITDSTAVPAKATPLTGTSMRSPFSKGQTAARSAQSFRDLIAEGGRAPWFGVVARFNDVDDVVALRDFLVTRINSTKAVSTDLARLACKYDRLVFGSDFAGDRVALHAVLGLEWASSAPYATTVHPGVQHDT
jgi:hypothetical protein